jgi:hypothetical protein
MAGPADERLGAFASVERVVAGAPVEGVGETAVVVDPQAVVAGAADERGHAFVPVGPDLVVAVAAVEVAVSPAAFDRVVPAEPEDLAGAVVVQVVVEVVTDEGALTGETVLDTGVVPQVDVAIEGPGAIGAGPAVEPELEPQDLRVVAPDHVVARAALDGHAAAHALKQAEVVVAVAPAEGRWDDRPRLVRLLKIVVPAKPAGNNAVDGGAGEPAPRAVDRRCDFGGIGAEPNRVVARRAVDEQRAVADEDREQPARFEHLGDGRGQAMVGRVAMSHLTPLFVQNPGDHTNVSMDRR